MPDMLKRTYAFWRHGRNPYGEDLAELLLQAQTVRLKAARPRYSNLGFELLGHAVAAGRPSATWPPLLVPSWRVPRQESQPSIRP